MASTPLEEKICGFYFVIHIYKMVLLRNGFEAIIIVHQF